MIIFYPLFIIYSLLMPRNEKTWVFGCRKGYLDNTRYFFEYASQQNEFNCYWLANNKKEMDQVIGSGYKAILRDSLTGYIISTRAKMSFICTGYNDVNGLLSLRSNVIDFWHGTPIKKLFFDSQLIANDYKSKKDKLINFLRKSKLVFYIKNISFYYASNSFERKVVTASSRLSLDRSLALGAPRFDAIRSSQGSSFLDMLKIKYKKVFLYAPTWRDGGYPSENFKITKCQFLNLNLALESINAILIIKPHFKSNKKQFLDFGLLGSDNIIYSEDYDINDINDIYKYVDILITDVSSALFDYLIFDRPVIVFMPDIKEYQSNMFGIYDYFNDILLNHSVSSWSELIVSLNKASIGEHSNPKLFSDISKELSSLNNINKLIYDDLVLRFN